MLYNTSDCGPGSHWLGFYDRLRAYEVSRSWKAAQVSPYLKVFGPKNGKTYDTGIVKGNLDWLLHADGGTRWLKSCTTAPCLELQRHFDLCLFSWWTEVPYVKLAVAARMLSALGKRGCRGCLTPVGDVPENASL